MSGIVVGVDASVHATRAVAWALEDARRRGASVRLVHAYPAPEFTAMPALVSMPSEDELRRLGTAAVANALRAAGGPDGVAVETRVVAGNPARVLVAQAADADLLVVAARGLGGFRGLMLGSVSQQVVTHAPCPVVVVPPADEHDDRRADTGD